MYKNKKNKIKFNIKFKIIKFVIIIECKKKYKIYKKIMYILKIKKK